MHSVHGDRVGKTPQLRLQRRDINSRIKRENASLAGQGIFPTPEYEPGLCLSAKQTIHVSDEDSSEAGGYECLPLLQDVLIVRREKLINLRKR